MGCGRVKRRAAAPADGCGAVGLLFLHWRRGRRRRSFAPRGRRHCDDCHDFRDGFRPPPD